MSATPEPVGTLEVALAHARRLLQQDPIAAAEQAEEILKAVPGQPMAQLLLAAARRSSGAPDEAIQILTGLSQQLPRWAAVHFELGLAFGATRHEAEAVAALRRAVELQPDLSAAWRTLADHLTVAGDVEAADHAYAQHIRFSTRDPRLLEAGAALAENRIAVAEALLREHLKQFPSDVAAIRMFAEVAARLGRYADAEVLLERCLELAPSFQGARHNYAYVLNRQNKLAQALDQLERLLAGDPRNASYRNLQAAVLGRAGEYDRALQLYAEVVKEYPRNAKVWMSYGHALKTAGQQGECVDTYRRAIELSPQLGEAYWSLANLKTFRFTDRDVAAMQAQLRRDQLSEEDRFHFHFSLGKAFEDAGDYAKSFEHYEVGNRLRRELVQYDADENSQQMRRSKQLLSQEFFAKRADWGSPAPDPIFIVGLPRAGSTLLEQILSSHPLVEGTMELPDILDMARALGGGRARGTASKYPEVLAELSVDELRALGEQYIANTRIQRKSGTPFFIDKMPNNFAHIGLIQLILPRAKIIDARRHPLGCCFSGFKQHFARGQHFTYGLEDLGRYYRDYVELMAHFDTVLPGRVHRVIYETLVDDTETQVRRLLDYCGLPFDERCLRFYENERAVRTASSEQVRRPIYRDGVDHWQHYEPWLVPLKRALGPVLESYPAVPEKFS
ncbi:tetratricopeptide repeat-containing sulfotransferase family protein [Steroidobacter sp.]|uniref:tetratricopeptide repeat-containing sulfotransferase family protein n=1 Tax=Steroidobacter sp. TaxID=1978227 RepID=UPI001A39E1A5|nr:tetratricopeptide repeat-containing sulfotransferase family protein [Steroidobacter sp.]MBL8270673.1 sulfotransferase [Steroidobacter sp.]